MLGAGEWKTLWRVTIPLSLPGVIAGCILTYTACITAFVTQTLIVLPDKASCKIQNTRPIRSETRATLVASTARGRIWLDEMTADPKATTESIAKRERCSPRKINKTISLAFLAPELVKAAIEGKLPHGMGVARLFDLPAEWSRQRQVLGLAAQ